MIPPAPVTTPTAGTHSMSWDNANGIPQPPQSEFSVTWPPPSVKLASFGGGNGDGVYSSEDGSVFVGWIGTAKQYVTFFSDGTGIQLPSGKTFHWN